MTVRAHSPIAALCASRPLDPQHHPKLLVRLISAKFRCSPTLRYWWPSLSRSVLQRPGGPQPRGPHAPVGLGALDRPKLRSAARTPAGAGRPHVDKTEPSRSPRVRLVQNAPDGQAPVPALYVAFPGAYRPDRPATGGGPATVLVGVFGYATRRCAALKLVIRPADHALPRSTRRRGSSTRIGPRTPDP